MHELVSSQLDMDRLDYLARDSFFSGVVEGQVGSERLIKMLDVVDDRLVVEEKGIYSIEKFIVARRFMYWQVYLHKTVLSAEFMLLKALHRARALAMKGEVLFASPALRYFLYQDATVSGGDLSADALHHYAQLDDFDIAGAIKVWQGHTDNVLSELCMRLMHRRLFKIEIHRESIDPARIDGRKTQVAQALQLTDDEVSYFVICDKV
ncbi:MAG: phosphohydrolase, partial [Flavobacteriales bacterium]